MTSTKVFLLWCVLGLLLGWSFPSSAQTCPTGNLVVSINGGSTGCGTTNVQTANVTTASDGTFSVSFATAFTSSSPVINVIPLNTGGTLPVVCDVLTRSSSGMAGKCWQASSQLVSLLGVNVNVFPSGAASMVVMVIAREPSQ